MNGQAGKAALFKAPKEDKQGSKGSLKEDKRGSRGPRRTKGVQGSPKKNKQGSKGPRRTNRGPDLFKPSDSK